MATLTEDLSKMLIPFSYITDKNTMEFVAKDNNLNNINDILKLPKGIQITAFSYIQDTSLNNFLILRDNKEAMKLLYEFLFENKRVSFDDFLKTNPDYELQSYFYLNHLFLLFSSSYENEIDIDKLDERAQIIIIKKIIIIVKELNNLNKLKLKKKYEILVKKFLKDILPLVQKERDYNIHIPNILKSNTDKKFQSILFFLILEETNLSDDIKENLFLKLNQKAQTLIINIWDKLQYESGFFYDIINKIDIEALVEYFMDQKKTSKIYQNFSGIFRKRKKLAFKHLQFQTQMNIIEDAPKEKKTFYFSILPEEYRTKETLSKIENIDYKTVEKYLSNKKKEFKKEDKKKDENKTNIGISKEAFKERLKLFDTKK